MTAATLTLVRTVGPVMTWSTTTVVPVERDIQTKTALLVMNTLLNLRVLIKDGKNYGGREVLNKKVES